jgi:hypothetical protein
MNLRDFLGQREKELTEQLAELHGKVAPLETDLALFQKTKAVVNRPIKEFAVGKSACGDALAEYAEPTPASTALRHFLVHQEEDLTAQINEIRSQLMPLEAELGEVRRAKAAIGAGAPRRLPNQGMVDALVGFGRMAMALTDAQRRAREILQTEQAKYDIPVMLPASSPYSTLTMKQLIAKVLHEHFRDGGTTRQMLDFFRDAWGRDIERTNLSPQISRLYQEGVIGRIRSTRGWFLYKRDGLVEGFRPYLHQGRIIWCEPQSTNLGYEPLVAKDIASEVANDRMPYKRTVTTTTNGVTNRSVMLVWLLDHEIQGDDAPALRHEFPTPDED